MEKEEGKTIKKEEEGRVDVGVSNVNKKLSVSLAVNQSIIRLKISLSLSGLFIRTF